MYGQASCLKEELYMPLHYENLDSTTRKFMQEEIQSDISSNKIYKSPRLNEQGEILWPSLLLEAAALGDDETLAAKLRYQKLLKERETRNSIHGVTTKAVPVNAPETLSEGEFNRYYARGVCLHSISNGSSEVTVYRARTSSNPRATSEEKIGMVINAKELLDDLREHNGVDTALGLPPGPNSGLSIKL